MSVQPEVRRAETGKELDRGTWADLDAVDFHFTTTGNGEAIAGPFYFGRAYDAPPAFSFSAALIAGSSGTAPHITVGVSEWLLDEQEMYVGANLWVKISENCFDPLAAIVGDGAIVSDDIESVLAKQGGGPEGDELPYFGRSRFDVQGGSAPDIHENYSSLYWPSQYPITFPEQIPFKTFALGDRVAPYRWVQFLLDNVARESEDASLVQRWRVTDDVSRSGQYSFFCDELIRFAPAPFVQISSTDLYPVDILGCRLRPELEQFDHLVRDQRRIWGWRCDPETEVNISFHRMHNWVHSNLGAWAALTWGLAFYGVNPGFETHSTTQAQPGEFGWLGGGRWNFFLDPASSSGEGLVANEWQYRELLDGFRLQTRDTNIALPGTMYVEIWFDVFQYLLEPVFHATQVPPFKTWVDDITIKLTPQSPQRQPEFNVTVKFGGRLLKNYVGVHPLRSYEHPDRVVLS
jgi:hypothetical protein